MRVGAGGIRAGRTARGGRRALIRRPAWASGGVGPVAVMLAVLGLFALPPAGASAGAAPAAAGAASAVAVSAGGFTALPGARLIDTRRAGGALAVGVPRSVQVTGLGGVPASGVAAVALTVTVTAAPVSGHVAVYPDGTAWPGTSTINFVAGQTVANQTIVAVSPDGRVAVRSGIGSTHAILDVTGWYAAGGGTVSGGFVGTAPRRLLDTRLTAPLAGAAAVATVPVAGLDGIPANASGAVLNVTAVRPSTDTYLTAWPAGTARPGTSLLNVRRATVVASLAVVGVGSDGAVAISPGGAAVTHLVVDLLGWFTAGPPAAGGVQQIAPRRLVDTRRVGGALRANDPVEVLVTGRAGVPLSRVAAVVATVTAVPAKGTGGYLTAWPSGTARPVTSVLNPRPDGAVASTGLFAVGADGGIDVYNYAGTAHLVLDVTGYVLAPATAVAPALPTGADVSPLTGPAQEQARNLLTTSNRYALRTWWPSTAPGLLATPSATGDGLRRLSMVALSLAVAVRTGGYDAAATGADAATATDVAVRSVDAVAGAHMANRPGGWGSSWQSALWSSLAARAAWLVWDDLPAATRDRVARMVEWEADQSLLVPTRYLRNRAGVLVSSGDSGAEENSWFALAPALATAMLPQHPHWTAWRNRQEQLLVASWSQPTSLGSTALVDGRSVGSWLGGSNVEPSGAVINHRRVAPDYSTTAYQSIDTLLVAALAGTPAPQASVWGLAPVYGAQVTVSYATPTYLPPGGTVYSRTLPAVYYPQGCDWGTGQQLPYALLDTQAQLFGFDRTGTAAANAGRHAGAAVAMQARNADGAMYVGTAEYNYVGREEHTAQLAGQLYLSHFVHDRLRPVVAPSVASWAAGGRVLPGLVTGTATANRIAPTDERQLQEG